VPGVALDCNVIGDERPTTGQLIVFGDVVLPDQTSAPALQTSRQPDPSRALLTFFAKSGLGFKAGSKWRLMVPADARNHLRIQWGSPGTATTVIRPPSGCAKTSTTGWVWYPGGYWTDEPGCYPIVVDVNGQTRRVNVGVGAPCPGQDPPASPSDN